MEKTMPAVAYADASLKDGRYGIGVMLIHKSGVPVPLHYGGPAKEGKTADDYEGEAIEFAALVCNLFGHKTGKIINDNRNASYESYNIEGFEVRCTCEESLGLLDNSLHIFAHNEAKKGRVEATV